MILKDWIKLDRQTIEGNVIRNHGKGKIKGLLLDGPQ